MELVVLGSSASFPAAGDACSGYLVRDGDTALLLDCGSGVLGRLQRYVPVEDLTGIVVSHLHPDHYIDLVALRYGLRYGEGDRRPVPVYLPPGGIAHLEAVGHALSKTQPFFAGALDLHEYEPGHAIPLGGFEVTPHEVVHGIRSFALRVENGRVESGRVVGGGRRFTFSSDTVVCDALVEAARDADLLLAEATLGGGAPDHHDPRTHLSAVEAGEIAQRAGAASLVLTHFWHTADRALAEREASSVFSGRVAAAQPDARFEV